MVPYGEALKLAIIPARGGSKRIPRKNIKQFCGKPILAYSIEAVIQSELFSEVMVSTEDVLLEVVEKYHQTGRDFSYICCIYPTAPFVTAQKLRSAFRLFYGSGADALVPVVPFSYPPLRGFILQNERIRMKWPEYEAARSQDLQPIYHDCGQFYFAHMDAFLREKTLFCEETVPMVLPELEVQDIDNETDWELAELKYELLKRKGLL